MSKEIWAVNSVQFPRLIAELVACGSFTPEVMRDLSKSMDLDVVDICALLDRAQTQWEAIKRMHCPPAGVSDGHVKCGGCGNEIDPEVCHCGELVKEHHMGSGHAPVPMGCDCGRADLPPTKFP